MKRILFLLLFLPLFVYGQAGIVQTLFVATDTVGTITAPDTVEVKLGDGPWKILSESVNDTAYVTVDDKVGEVVQVFNLAAEDWWTYANNLQVRVYSTGTDTITSKNVGIGGLRGAITLFLRPDTSGTNTTYTKSTVEGN